MRSEKATEQRLPNKGTKTSEMNEITLGWVLTLVLQTPLKSILTLLQPCSMLDPVTAERFQAALVVKTVVVVALLSYGWIQ